MCQEKVYSGRTRPIGARWAAETEDEPVTGNGLARTELHRRLS